MIEKKTHKSKKDIEHKQKKKSKSTHSRPDEVDQMESRTKEENPAAQEDSIPPKTDKRQKKRKLESSVQEQQHKTKGEKRSKQVEKLLNKMDNETQPEQSSTASPTKIKTKSSKKHKKTKKELPSDGDDVDSDKESVDSMCLTYLRMWKQNRDQWAFKKVRQVWLLQNMYSCDRVSTTLFTSVDFQKNTRYDASWWFYGGGVHHLLRFTIVRTLVIRTSCR